MNGERAWKIYVVQKQEGCYFTLQVKKQRLRVSKKIAYGDLVKYCRSRVHSVQFSCSVVSDYLRPHESQQATPPCPSPTPGIYWNSYPLSQWCHLTIPSFVVPFPSCPQSFPASGSFPVSWLFILVAKALELQLQHQSFQWLFRVNFL